MRFTVPATTQKTPAVTLCDAGADTRGGRTKPGAWVAVTIQAVGTCTPDANGRMLHAIMRFAIPGAQDCKRRRNVQQYSPNGVGVNDAIEVEFDHGTGWIGTKAELFLTGGTAGDIYDVTITEDVPRDQTDPDRVIDVYEDAFQFRLTSYLVVPDPAPPAPPPGYTVLPTPPAYHQWFYVVQGAAQLVLGASRLPLTNHGPDARVALSAPQIEVSSGIYVTEGSL